MGITKFPWVQKGHTVVLSRNRYIEEARHVSQLPGIVLMFVYQEVDIYYMKSTSGPWEISLQIVLRIVYCAHIVLLLSLQ